MIGAGSWGTALAIIAAKAGRGVTLWSRREDHARALREDSKARALVRAVRWLRERAAGREGGGSGKVVVFTESLTTQEYLRALRRVPSGKPQPGDKPVC